MKRKRYSRWRAFWDMVYEFLPYLAVLAVVCIIYLITAYLVMRCMMSR